MVEKPELFFHEAARVLKLGGRLSISTLNPSIRTPKVFNRYLSDLSRDMRQAAIDGLITSEVAEGMIESNKDIVKRVEYPLTLAQLVRLAEEAGFRILSSEYGYSGIMTFVAFEKIKN